MIGEPSQYALFELRFCSRDCAAVVGVRDFPHWCPGIVRLDLAGVPDWNVAVNLAMDQEDWDFGGGNRILGRDRLHVEVVLPACTEKCDFDNRAKDNSSHPRAQMEGLPNAVVGDLTKIREGRLSDQGTEVSSALERLQELRSAH